MSGTEWWLNELNWGLVYLTNFGVWVPFGLGLWCWRQLSAPARILILYFGFWSIEGFVDLWSRRVLHTNMYLFHVTVLVETLLLSWAYHRVLRAPAVRRSLLAAALLFTGICLLDAFVWSGLQNLNSYARAAQVTLIMSLVLLYFEQSLRQLKTRLWDDFMFVVSVAQAIYYAGSLMSYLMQQTLDGVAEYLNSIIIAISFAVPLGMMTWALWRETQLPANWAEFMFSKRQKKG